MGISTLTSSSIQCQVSKPPILAKYVTGSRMQVAGKQSLVYIIREKAIADQDAS
jgi:hypothetical protein